MTKERLEELRAKLDNPEYMNKACSEIGTRLAEAWSETNFRKPEKNTKKIFYRTGRPRK